MKSACYISLFCIAITALACQMSAKVPRSVHPHALAPNENDAASFLKRVDSELRTLWPSRDRASWVNQNFITDDTEIMAAAAETKVAEYMTKTIKESLALNISQLSKEQARMLHLLRVAQIIPAPNDEANAKELARLQSAMTSAYGKAQYCPTKNNCKNIDQLSKIIATSREYETLKEAWQGWHDTAKDMRKNYASYVAIANQGAKDIGFSDVGELWRSSYDQDPKDFEADIERLWSELKPFYESLHCYVRMKLRTHYGAKISEATIPAHVLGNLWAQEWQHIYDLVEPYKNEPKLDIDRALVEKKWDAQKMLRLGESFFTSLGLDPLPKTFWERSLFTRPKDREVLCHASAFDVSWNDDLRVKMCIEPKAEDLFVIHHEFGHLYYYHAYHKLPMLFQNGANDGFHEGIGDTLTLSMTPHYFKQSGLIEKVADNPRSTINQQMKMALDKVAFLPFGLLIDKWRWDVFAGKIKEENYNQAWWDLRKKYQGVHAPMERGEEFFDPGAKFHIPGSTPYIRYFLARIYQFQFHRALCKASGHSGPLDQCSIYGNKEAGKKLQALLLLGASKSWPEAMAELSGETKADANALLDYFKPLQDWLKEQTKNEKCGW